MKKVLMVVGTLNCGGTENIMINLLREKQKKYKIDFLVFGEEKFWFEDEVKEHNSKIIRIKKCNYFRIFFYINEIKKIIKNGDYFIVHSHIYLNSGIIMLSAFLGGAKVRISHSHSAIINNVKMGFNYKFKRFFLRPLIIIFSTNMVACSYEAGLSLYGKCGIKLKKYLVLLNPINIDRLLSFNKKEIINLKEKFKIKNEIVIGHVGSFNATKNQEYIIDILCLLKTKNIPFKMIFIGNGELLSYIKELSVKYGIIKDIIFTGTVKNVQVYYQLMDVYIMPSLYEGMPLSAMEAQISGLPCVFSNNITKSIDLNINKVDFINIYQNDKIKWVDCIINNSKIKKINSQKISEINRFGINNYWKELNKLYK